MWLEKGSKLVAYTTAPEEGSLPSTKGGTTQDGRDMWRVGRDQELNVSRHLRGGSNFGFLADWHSAIFDSSRCWVSAPC